MCKRSPRFLYGAFLIITIISNAAIAQDYCEVGGGCDEYISRVLVTFLDNPSGCVGYSDFTDLTADMELGQDYLITMIITNGYSSDSGGVWVDWNRDYDFDDPGEAIHLDVSGGYGPYYGTIHVPGHVQPGWARLRIRLCFNQTPYPCGITQFGELEDYSIMLTGDPYVCGDANGDDDVNLADAVYIINYVFRTGPAPNPLEAGDANCDDDVNVADAVYLINYVFKNGPEPCCP
jgi:hypothetical protein